LITKDLGRLDELGNLHVVGRSDDAIRSGGETIYPAEVEAALDHPEITEVVVVGVPDAEWGQTPVAFVVSRTPTLRGGEILDWLVPTLARYKWPRILFVERIPRLPNGKPDRAKLLATYDPSCEERPPESR
jgi:acyl-CoA synthetase (AMP-forming)/AMP-acid ligase II